MAVLAGGAHVFDELSAEALVLGGLVLAIQYAMLLVAQADAAEEVRAVDGKVTIFYVVTLNDEV